MATCGAFRLRGCINTCRARYRDCQLRKEIPPFECRDTYQDCARLALEGDLFLKLCVSEPALARMRSYEEKKITSPSRSIEV